MVWLQLLRLKVGMWGTVEARRGERQPWWQPLWPFPELLPTESIPPLDVFILCIWTSPKVTCSYAPDDKRGRWKPWAVGPGWRKEVSGGVPLKHILYPTPFLCPFPLASRLSWWMVFLSHVPQPWCSTSPYEPKVTGQSVHGNVSQNKLLFLLSWSCQLFCHSKANSAIGFCHHICYFIIIVVAFVVIIHVWFCLFLPGLHCFIDCLTSNTSC